MAHPRSRLEKGFVGLMGSTLFVVFLSPLLALALRSVTRLEANPVSGGGFQTAWTGAYYQELFINRRGSLFYVPPVEAMRNSLVYAGVAVLITLVLGMLITAALERRNQRGAITDVLVTLPLGASAVSLGLGLLLLSSGMTGGALLAILLVPIAHSVVALPFFTRTVQPALASIPLALKESAAVLGASAGRIGGRSPCRSSGGRSWRGCFSPSRSRWGNSGRRRSWLARNSRPCRSPFRATLPCREPSITDRRWPCPPC